MNWVTFLVLLFLLLSNVNICKKEKILMMTIINLKVIFFTSSESISSSESSLWLLLASELDICMGKYYTFYFKNNTHTSSKLSLCSSLFLAKEIFFAGRRVFCWCWWRSPFYKYYYQLAYHLIFWLYSPTLASIPVPFALHGLVSEYRNLSWRP